MWSWLTPGVLGCCQCCQNEKVQLKFCLIRCLKMGLSQQSVPHCLRFGCGSSTEPDMNAAIIAIEDKLSIERWDLQFEIAQSDDVALVYYLHGLR